MAADIMVTDILVMLLVFAVSLAVAYLLILRVPVKLHTPLMSMTNAISGVTLFAAILLFRQELSLVEQLLGVIAVFLAAFNMFGGFAVTYKMLGFFARKEKE